MVEYHSREDAWDFVESLFPRDSLVLDETSSEKAGYHIYRQEGHRLHYVCCLGDRFEVNDEDGRTENVWIRKSQRELELEAEVAALEKQRVNLEGMMKATEAEAREKCIALNNDLARLQKQMITVEQITALRRSLSEYLARYKEDVACKMRRDEALLDTLAAAEDAYFQAKG